MYFCKRNQTTKGKVMKKLILATVCAILCCGASAQISIKREGSCSNTSYVAKSRYYGIKCQDSVYTLSVKDIDKTERLDIRLGTGVDEAYTSLATLYGWFKSAKVMDYIVFESEGASVTMYKYTSTVPYFSNGDAEYIKDLLHDRTVKGVFGGREKKSDDGKVVGCVDGINELAKAMAKLKPEERTEYVSQPDEARSPSRDGVSLGAR